MNRTLNQLINQLHLDPKKEAAVRKIVENAGGINDSTPVVTEVSGNELLPINVNGENKAVSAAALVKGAKEVYFLDTNNYKTSEDYNNLKAAVESNKIIIVDIENSSIIASALLDTNQIVLSFHVAVPLGNHGLQVNTFLVEFKPDGTFTFNILPVNFITDGNGTKFLSDDGTYKEVSGGGGPVIIEYPVEATDPIAITDEQIEAFKNSNVKIKLVDASEGPVLICIPYIYSIIGDSGMILIRMSDGTTISDATFIVDITNKTIFWQQ